MSDNKEQTQSKKSELHQLPSNSFSGAVGDLLKLAFGPSANEIGKILNERLRSWHYKLKNAENISNKVQNELSKRNIDAESIQPIAEGDGFRLFEASSMEDEETVQILWARLAANAMDPSKRTKIRKAYVDILSAISPAEVALLIILKKINTPIRQTTREEKPDAASLQKAALKHQAEIIQESEKIWRVYSVQERATAIQNLIRLRCITIRSKRQLEQTKVLRGVWGRQDIQIDARNLVSALDHLEQLIFVALGSTEIDQDSNQVSSKATLPEAKYDLTQLGISLMEACSSSD